MNKVILVLCVIALIGCKNSEKKAAKEEANSKTTKTEKATKTAEVPEIKTKTVTFSVKVIHPYCGGAAPSDDMENNRMKGEPAKEFVFYVNANDGNPIRLQTNMEGSVSLELANGDYCIKEGYKSDPDMIAKLKGSDWEFDEECLSKWKAQCNENFTVSDTSTNKVSFTYRPRCGWEGPVPCITNTGFPPP